MDPNMSQGGRMALDRFVRGVERKVVNLAEFHSVGSQITEQDVLWATERYEDRNPGGELFAFGGEASYSAQYSRRLSPRTDWLELREARQSMDAAVRRQRARWFLMLYAALGVMASLAGIAIMVANPDLRSGGGNPSIITAVTFASIGLAVVSVFSVFVMTQRRLMNLQTFAGSRKRDQRDHLELEFLFLWRRVESLVLSLAANDNLGRSRVGIREAISSLVDRHEVSASNANEFFSLLALRNDLVHGGKIVEDFELDDAIRRARRLSEDLGDITNAREDE